MTSPSGPAMEGSSTRVFAPLTELSASTRERFASSLRSEVSIAFSESALEPSSVVEEAIFSSAYIIADHANICPGRIRPNPSNSTNVTVTRVEDIRRHIVSIIK